MKNFMRRSARRVVSTSLRRLARTGPRHRDELPQGHPKIVYRGKHTYGLQ